MSDIRRFGIGRRLCDFIVRGDTIHFSGYVAESAVGGSVAEQTRDILEQIEASLARGGQRQVEAHRGDHLARRHREL